MLMINDQTCWLLPQALDDRLQLAGVVHCVVCPPAERFV
jgi:hypothetical protein